MIKAGEVVMVDLISKIILISFVSLGLILVLGFLYVYDSKAQSCVNNPLVFAAQQYEDMYRYPFVGIGFLKTPMNVRGPYFVFNSDNVTITIP